MCNLKQINIINEVEFVSLVLGNYDQLDIITLGIVTTKGFLRICAKGNIWQFHLIIAGMNIDYKEQRVIIDIKSVMQCSRCHVPSKKCKNFCKVWPKQTHESTHAQFAQQDTVE